MTPEEAALSNINSEDYITMRSMLCEIELKLMAVDPMKQMKFYGPLKNMIYEAWQDACNPNDSFLYSQNSNHP